MKPMPFVRPLPAFLPATLLLPLLACTSAPPETPEELAMRIDAIHDRAVAIDTHVDIPGERYATPELDPGVDHPSLRCDLAKMEQGGVDGVFLAVFVGQRGGLDDEGFTRAHQRALLLFEAIHRLPAMYPERCALVRSTGELPEVLASGRRAIMIGIENGYPVGDDLANLARFHALGARYITLAHTGHNQICDSSGPEEPLHDGLSKFGEEVVAEMNRLGIMIDVSHISEKSFRDVLETTAAPVIASHSGCHARRAHDRNLTDEQLRALAENGGTIQIVALGHYLKEKPAEMDAAVADLRKELALPSGEERQKMTPAEREALVPRFEEYRRRRAELEETLGGPSIEDLLDHIEHAVKIAGIDHVGIGTDFDGGGGIPGFQTHAEAREITRRLVERGFSEEEIQKIWGGNLLRVWGEVERLAER
jgi:membrane dipeptidase